MWKTEAKILLVLSSGAGKNCLFKTSVYHFKWERIKGDVGSLKVGDQASQTSARRFELTALREKWSNKGLQVRHERGKTCPFCRSQKSNLKNDSQWPNTLSKTLLDFYVKAPIVWKASSCWSVDAGVLIEPLYTELQMSTEPPPGAQFLSGRRTTNSTTPSSSSIRLPGAHISTFTVSTRV